MANIIQQLEDLKEWGQDPTRYARRLEFRHRSGAPSMEGMMVPEEFDELSPREEEYYKQEPFSTREDFLGAKGGVAQLVQPGPEGVRQGYGKTATSPNYVEKGIYRRDNGNYRLVANREGAKKFDKTLPKGSTLEDARKALSAWENANPIKVKWKEGQKIKIITEGPKGKQVNIDIKYKTPKIEADFKAAMADFAGENKAGWSKAKFENTFGGIADEAMLFAREQDPTLVRDLNKIQTLKYADELEELGHKDWNAAIKAGDDKLVMSHHWKELNPYELKGYDVSRNQLAKNIENLKKFEKSGQTLDDFYDLFKDRTFKANLRAYMKGEAGPYVTQAWDEAGFKSKYKNIMPKLKKHLEVWHEQSDPSGKTKAQIKKAKVREFSKLDIENMIGTAKRVKKTDYLNQLDLAHRQDLIIDQNISELGIERPEINRVLIKDAEIERNKLHKKNFALIEEVKKGKNVQKNLSLIAENNHRIQKIANITKGRLTGIIIDTETLAPIKLKPSNIMGVDAGIFNKPIKEMTEADKIYLKNKILPTVIDEARAMTPQKIASELSGIMDDPVLSKKLETRISKLETGRQITKPVFEQSKEIYRLMQQLGCGLHSGGRVAFANAGKVDCFGKGLEKIKTGNIATKGDAAVMKKIVQAGAKKGAARTALLWLGPLGIGGDVLFEAGDIAAQMLGGKPLDEALRNNWITGMFTEGTEKEARDIKVFKDTGPGAKRYVEGSNAYNKLQSMYKVLDVMKQKQSGSRGKITDADIKKQEQDIEAQKRYVIMLDKKESAFIGGAGEEEYRKASDELADKRTAGSYATAQRLKYREDPPTSDRYKSMNIDISLPPAMPKEKQFDTVDKMADAFIDDDEWNYYKDKGFTDKTDLFVEKRKQIPEFNEQVWHNIMNYGDPDIKGTQDSFFGGTYDRVPEGPHFAGGGIANVRRPNAIPPVSGPMPQGGGLSTMFNRVKPW